MNILLDYHQHIYLQHVEAFLELRLGKLNPEGRLGIRRRKRGGDDAHLFLGGFCFRDVILQFSEVLESKIAPPMHRIAYWMDGSMVGLLVC